MIVARKTAEFALNKTQCVNCKEMDVGRFWELTRAMYVRPMANDF